VVPTSWRSTPAGAGTPAGCSPPGVSVVADGTPSAAIRLRRALDGDSGLGVIRHAVAGYETAQQAAEDTETLRLTTYRSPAETGDHASPAAPPDS
jgi:urocanate hydratase